MKTKSLLDICSPKQWKTISLDMLTQEGYPVYGANGIIGKYKEYNHKERTLLVTCRGATCGSLNICEPYSYVTGNSMALDNLTPDIKLEYLYYYLSFRGFNDIITGSAQPQIVRNAFTNVLVTYPTLDQQHRIVAILDQVNDLISLRNQQLEQLDLLVKSRFVEMFGDDKKAPKVTMADITSIITDGTHQPPKFQTSGIPFIFVSNITTNELDYKTEKFISQETYDELYKRTPIEIGDLLLSTVGSYGHSAIVKKNDKFLFQRHIAYLKPIREKINSVYLQGVILTDDVQRQIDKAVKGIAQKTLNLSEVKKLTIPLPPLALQNQFAEFVQQVDKSKLAIKKSLEQLETLKKKLMQDYFG